MNVGNQTFARYDGQVIIENTNKSRDRKQFKPSVSSPTLLFVSKSLGRLTGIIKIKSSQPYCFLFCDRSKAPTVLREAKSSLRETQRTVDLPLPLPHRSLSFLMDSRSKN